MLDVYPPPPAVVPAGLTDAPSSYRRKAWIAGLALVGFLLVYAGLTGWFGYKAFTLLRDAMRGGKGAFWGFVAGGTAAFLTVFLGKALFFVRRHHDRGLVELTRDEQPKLFAFLHQLAADTGAPAPHRVFVSPRVNAAVFYDLRLVNLLIPSRKNLEIGVGLVNVLTLSELKAVLAHEFGHFAQRSMAVGNWVYVGQQIAGAVVAKRDVFDRFLRGISGIDLRVAWIGWGLRIVVWSIRSVFDSLFGAILVAERALSREMELQADLVSVSVTGSDALIHALHKLRAADGAWDHAVDVFAQELRAGRGPHDLCAMHQRVLENTRWMLSDPHWGDVAVDPRQLDAEARPRHRVFQAGLAQPPQMWSTHPPSHIREDNAKRRYVEAELDTRPAWLAFDDADDVRRRIAAKVVELIGSGEASATHAADGNAAAAAPASEAAHDVDVAAARPEAATTSDQEAARAAVDATFAKLRLDPRYRGSYRGRCITRQHEDATTLCDVAGTTPDREALRETLADLYPPSSGELVERLDGLQVECSQLDAIRRGVASAPGGVVRHRGGEVRKRDLGRLVAEVERERDEVLAELHARDRKIRSAHAEAAVLLGRGWPEYLAGLRALLHYAEHTEAHVDEAGAHLRNVTDIVMADGRVSGAEIRRLVASGSDLQYSLAQVFEDRGKVHLPFAVTEKLGAASWSDALPEALQLPPPSDETIGRFMDVVGGWFSAFSNALGALRAATLEVLLATEHHVAACILDGSDPGDATDVARVPPHYTRFCHGAERPLQLKLDAWDRFMTADGWGPGFARLGVAGAVVAVVVGFGGSVSPQLTIHNGLARPVIVTLDDRTVTVEGLADAAIALDGAVDAEVTTRTVGGEVIEHFTGAVDSAVGAYVYSVGGGSLMVIETVAYGRARSRDPQVLGAPRWFESTADFVLVDPPPTDTDATTATVLRAFDAPEFALGAGLSELETARVMQLHARWEPVDGVGAAWLAVAGGTPEVFESIEARLVTEPGAVILERIAQDASKGEAHVAVCERSRTAAARAPGDPDAAYLAARCLDDPQARDARFLALERDHPTHGWIAHAAAIVHAEHDEIDAAVAALERAMQALPMLDVGNAVTLARLLRLAQGARTDAIARLARRSLRLRLLVSGDPDAGEARSDEDDRARAYRYLARGDLGTARSLARGDAALLRLIAASDGATEQDLARVDALGPGEGSEGAALWAALAQAHARARDPAPYLAALGERVPPEDVERMLRFCDPERLLADPEGADASLRTLAPELRGHAAVMGVITLREAAPPRWREDARRLLFARERPYLADPEPGAGAPRGPATP